MKFYSDNRKSYPHRLGPVGWGYAGRYGVERYLYTLHRLTGLGILFYLVLHIYVTGFKVGGEEAWESVMGFLGQPIFKLGEFGLFFAVVFHATNGIRLILTELGFLLGKPVRPVYPYELAMSRQRVFMFLMIALTAVIMIYGGLDFFVLK